MAAIVGSSASTQRTYSIPPEKGVLITAPISGWSPNKACVIDPTTGGQYRCINSGNVYQVITNGTTAGSGGPSGTGSNITDGTVHWKFLGQHTGQAVTTGSQIVAYVARGVQSTVPSGSAGIPPFDNLGGTFTTMGNFAYNGFADSYCGVFYRSTPVTTTSSYQVIASFGGTSNGSGAGDELTLGWMEIRNVPFGAPHTSSHNEVANANASGICQSATITTTKPCIIVSIWAGNGNVLSPGQSHTAIPLNGLTMVSGCNDLVALGGNGYIQVAIATRLATASLTPFAEQWSVGSAGGEGAQLFTLAFEDTTLTGNLGRTLENVTLSSAGTISLIGSRTSGTLGTMTASSSGSISIVGTLVSGNLATMVGSGAGTGQLTGVGVSTLADATLSSAGTISAVGTLSSGTLGNMVANATGSITLQASLTSGTLGAVSLSSSGSPIITGGLTSGNLAALTAQGSGSVKAVGSGSITLQSDTISSAGQISLVGTLASGTLAGMTAQTTGGPFLLGSLASGTLSAMTLSATAATSSIAGLSGSGAAQLANTTLSSSGSPIIAGSGSLTLSPTSIVAAGVASLIGLGSNTLGTMTLQSAGGSPIVGVASLTLADMTAVGTASFTTASINPDRSIPTGTPQSIPPITKPIPHRVIKLEDIDRGVKSWFEHVVAASVQSPQGSRRAVPVLFASGERWVAAADRKGIRDRDGRLILPVIQVRRTGFNGTEANMSALGTDTARLQIARQVSEKTTTLKNLDMLRPISTRRIRDSVVYDVYSVPFPRRGIATYKVKIQTQYQTHINDIIEKIESRLNFVSVPSFVIGLDGYNRRTEGVQTGRGTSEIDHGEHPPFDRRKKLSDCYVVGYMNGDFGESGNVDEFTDSERILETTFTFKVPVSLFLDPEGTEPNVQVERTAFGINLGTEQVILVEDSEMADRIFGREK